MINSQDLLNSFTARSALAGIDEKKVTLSLVQTALLMAIEGVKRASASEIAEKTAGRYGYQVTASYVGQTFAMFGIGTTVTHGKSRYVLDAAQLEKIKKEHELQCQAIMEKLERAIKTFDELPARIKDLEKQWQDIKQLQSRERDLLMTIQENGQNVARLRALQDRAKQLQEQTKQADALEKECQTLSEKVKALPSIVERNKQLEASIIQYQKEQTEIANKENTLKQMIEALKPRKGWVNLAAINEAIVNANQQLIQINKQIGERRSILDRILGRDPE